MWKNILRFLLFGFWIGSAAYTFWNYQLRHYVFYQDNGAISWESFYATLQKELGRYLPAGALPAVIYFRDPECLCKRYSDSRIEKIIDTYNEFRYILVPAPGRETTFGERDEDAKRYDLVLPGALSKKLWNLLPAGPVAVVVDQNFRVAYFGPYEAGGFCGSSGEGFVEATLDTIRRGEPIMNINLWEKGCFCASPKKKI